MKGETKGLSIEEFFGLKSKMYSFLVDNNSEYEKAKGVKKCFYKDVLLNNKCLRHSMNRTQRKKH